MENNWPIIFPIQKFLLYYNMKKSYKKAIAVIDSCNTSVHTLAAYNYIWNFSKLFVKEKGCKELTRKLHARCSRKRKIVENK
jgi:hypothetical protein